MIKGSEGEPRGAASSRRRVNMQQTHGRGYRGQDYVCPGRSFHGMKGPLGGSSPCPFLSYDALLAVFGSRCGA